jgi:glycosyltransferase involved in cell wall biosynthesis
MDKPFFSIIIPTYNRGELLRKSIESVINQTFSNWELLVIDDGSTDNTKDIVLSYKDSRIKYIYQVNAERSAARNNGIVHAMGTYVCFLDSDDYFTRERLQKLYNSIIALNSPVAFFYTAIVFDRPDGMWKRPEVERGKTGVFDFIATATIGNPQVCIHNNILQKHKYNPAFTIGEDMELWLRIVVDYEPIYLAEQYTVVALDHDDRSVNFRRHNSYVKQLQVVKHCLTQGHPGTQISKPIQHFLLSKAYFGIAKYYIYNNNRLKAAEMLLKTILVDTKNKQAKFRLNILLHVVNPFISLAKVEKLID